MRKTKIICTLGPSTDDENVLRSMMNAGMNVARFNFSHQSHEEHKSRAEMIKRLRDELNLPIAMLADTKGPEIRLGTFENGSETLVEGQKFTLTTRDVSGTNEIASITFKGLPHDVRPTTRILIDDGLIELVVEHVNGEDIQCVVKNGGTVKDRKGINVPNAQVSLPFLSEQDCADLKFAVENGFDFVAASFSRCAEDIMQMRGVLNSYGGQKIRIIAKIENAQGVENIDSILNAADGIMVARGDLGVEIPFEEIPVIQKKLIKKAYKANKQVITATQMLDSMINNPRPTRAETTDVANAIYDGTSAIMLSGETAAGKYPVTVVEYMARIAERTERDIDYGKRFFNSRPVSPCSVSDAISHATCAAAIDVAAAAIITVTMSGKTARMISSNRPYHPIFCCTPDKTVMRQLNLSWGVYPLYIPEAKSTDELLDMAVNAVMQTGALKDGDLAVVTSGAPLNSSNSTNMLRVYHIGETI